MVTFLYVLMGLSFALGIVVLFGAKGVFHEMAGFMLFVNASVLLIGAAIVNSINSLHKRIDGGSTEAPPDPRWGRKE